MSASNTTLSNGSSIDFLSLQQMSIEFVRQQQKYKIVQAVTSSVNMVFCWATLCVFQKFSQNYQSSTFYFLRLFFITDLLWSACTLILDLWHIANAIYGLPEMHPIRTCFLINQLEYVFFRTSSLYSLWIALDRLLIMSRKQGHHTPIFNHKQKEFVLIAMSPVIISVILHIIVIFDQYDPDMYLIFCATRLSFGKNFSALIFLVIPTMASYAAFFIYFFMLIVAGSKYRKLINNLSPNDSVEIAQLKRSRKITQVLSHTAIVYFFLGGPLVSSIIASLQGPGLDFLFTLSSLLTAMLMVKGIFYTISLLFVQQFREDFLKILPKQLFGFLVKNDQGQGVIGMNQIHPATSNPAPNIVPAIGTVGQTMTTSHL